MRQVLICGALVVTLSMGIRHGFGLWLQPITQAQGWTRETFSFAIAIQNLSWGVFGVFAGMLADRLGVKPVLIAGLAIQAIVIAAYLSISKLEQFYMLAVIFGATYGGVMPLYAVLAREYFGQRILGTVFGAATMLSSLGMALGPLAGGMVFDAYASYSWLFIGSAIIGLGAAGIAIAFPPLPRRALQAA